MLNIVVINVNMNMNGKNGLIKYNPVKFSLNNI